ncbi:MAG TPA: hypothetical protein VMV79_04655 [Alphaproteobacteria bacterium]|nr:hypothetical protein [Alphaproteobacteria bacterium]
MDPIICKSFISDLSDRALLNDMVAAANAAHDVASCAANDRAFAAYANFVLSVPDPLMILVCEARGRVPHSSLFKRFFEAFDGKQGARPGHAIDNEGYYINAIRDLNGAFRAVAVPDDRELLHHLVETAHHAGSVHTFGDLPRAVESYLLHLASHRLIRLVNEARGRMHTSDAIRNFFSIVDCHAPHHSEHDRDHAGYYLNALRVLREALHHAVPQGGTPLPAPVPE